MNKALLTLATIGCVIALGAPAHADAGAEIYVTGASNGSVGYTVAVYATGALADTNTHQIKHKCGFSVSGSGNNIVLTIKASATASAHAVAVSTGIYCDVRDRDGNTVHWAAAAYSGTNASVASASKPVWNNGPYIVCSRGTGQWNDTHLYTTPTRCQWPNLPVVQPDDVVTLEEILPV